MQLETIPHGTVQGNLDPSSDRQKPWHIFAAAQMGQ
jgi:hypothetical protein